MQNCQTLVLASSRKRYAAEDQLLGLETEENKPMKALNVTIPVEIHSENLTKQLDFFEKNNMTPIWPDQNHFEGVMAGFFERMGETRALNKKHI